MEQQISELTDQMSRLHDEGIQLDTDLEENQSEKSVKYRDLKKREENMDSVSYILTAILRIMRPIFPVSFFSNSSFLLHSITIMKVRKSAYKVW